MFKFIKILLPPFLFQTSSFEENFQYQAFVSRLEQKEIDRLITQLFSSEEGKKALAYLQYITFQRVQGLNVSNEQLRYAEGQRAVVAHIKRIIERTKYNS